MERSIKMKKYVLLIIVVVLGVLLISIVPSQAHERFVFRGGVWLGPGPWWGPPYPYYPYPYYPNPPVVIQQQPQTYVQPSPQQPEEQNYWYFCTKPEGYYPYVKLCPGGWLTVVPPAAPPDERR